MPSSTPRPDLDVCIEAASRITASAIKSGELSSEAETVKKYFDDIYRHLVTLRKGT